MPITAHSPSLDRSVADLAGHPVVIGMAEDLTGCDPDTLAVLITAHGEPTDQMVTLANARFAERTGGERGRYLGTVAAAVIAAMKELAGQSAGRPATAGSDA